jgi:hypothetical protein
MGCTCSSVAVEEPNVRSNPIFDYRMSPGREAKVVRQLNMHGGLNELLEKNRLSTKSTSYDAIQKAYNNGLITKSTKQVCCQVNKEGNDGKHFWKKE